MFIGREKELAQLDKIYNSNRFEFCVIYGRRRVGKSELIKEFIKDKNAIYFNSLESTSEYNLESLISTIYSSIDKSNISNSMPQNYEQALDIIANIAKKEKIILVIDEYPYLAKSENSISSILQKYIDNSFNDSKLTLILCGSSLSFMKEQVLGYQSPLYGRRTAQLEITPFNYITSSKFFPNFSAEDKILAYSIFGGTPYYLKQIDCEKPLLSSVKDLFFNNCGLLFEEPNNLLKQELREPQGYNAVITAIANGATRLSEIASKTKFTTSMCDSYINKLTDIGLVEKKLSILKKNNKKGIYKLSENLFKFWYTYVQAGISLINQDKGDILVNKLKYTIGDYSSHIFENICVQFLWNNYQNLPFEPTDIGTYWGTDKTKKQEVEIDIMAVENNKMLVGECKWKNEKTGQAVLSNLIDKAMMFDSYTEKYYYLFSKSGFTDSLIESSKNNKNIKLISLDELFE